MEVLAALRVGEAARRAIARQTTKLSQQAIIVLDSSGVETDRIILSPQPQPTYTYPTPSNVAFDGTGRLLVANLDFNNPLGTGSAIFDVWVDDPGVPLGTPTT